MTPLRLILAALLTVGGILTLINHPMIFLALLLVLGSIGALLGGIWLEQLHSIGKEIDEDN